MGYNSADDEAVKRGQLHFRITPDKVGEREICVPQVEITRPGGFHQDVEILFSTLEAMYRFYGDGPTTTVWLCIAPELEEVPGYVAPALEQLVGFGIGLVITHGDLCSHDGSLKGNFIAPLKAALRGGDVWNPLVGKLVPAEID